MERAHNGEYKTLVLVPALPLVCCWPNHLNSLDFNFFYLQYMYNKGYLYLHPPKVFYTFACHILCFMCGELLLFP